MAIATVKKTIKVQNYSTIYLNYDCFIRYEKNTYAPYNLQQHESANDKNWQLEIRKLAQRLRVDSDICQLHLVYDSATQILNMSAYYP